MENIEKTWALLQLFAEAPDPGVTAEAAAQPSGVTAPETGDGAPAAEVPAEDPEEAFARLIEGPYRQQFNRKVRQILRKRLGTAKEPAREDGPAQEDAGAFLQSHGAAARSLTRDWQLQEQQLREFYPDFSMEKELADPRFARLLLQDVDIRTAYEVLHNHEILPAAMAYAARATEEALAKTIAANGARPPENATFPRAAETVRGDVTRLTPADINAIARRVAGGERISFG